MKTLSKIFIASSVAALSFSNAHAANDVHLIGQVHAVCEAYVDSGTLDFGTGGIYPGASLSTYVHVQCNDGDGAVVKLISSEGGLESDDNEDFSIEYNATLDEATTGLALDLTTTPGVGLNDEFDEQTLPGSLALAGGVYGELEVTISDEAVFAGGYSDTLTVTIAAN